MPLRVVRCNRLLRLVSVTIRGLTPVRVGRIVIPSLRLIVAVVALGLTVVTIAAVRGPFVTFIRPCIASDDANMIVLNLLAPTVLWTLVVGGVVCIAWHVATLLIL